VVVAYGIDIALGTPPQTVPVLLDIELSTFWVQDSACTAENICDHPYRGQTYNASASTSFKPTPDRLHVSYAGVIFSGPLSYDTLTIANLTIFEQPFLDGTDATFPGWFHLYQGFNGAVGFAPARLAKLPYVLSVWQCLIDENLLDQHVFAITPPMGKRHGKFESQTKGELVLGAYPDRFDADNSIRLPFQDSSNVEYPWAWATTLESLKFGDGIYEEFINGTAVYSTTDPSWSLPEQVAWSIIEMFGQRLGNRSEGWFPCESLELLPNLDLGIGGRNVEITPEQYTYRAERENEDGETETLCLMMLGSTGGLNDTIGLGIPFLKNYVAVFDIDKETVLCEYGLLVCIVAIFSVLTFTSGSSGYRLMFTRLHDIRMLYTPTWVKRLPTVIAESEIIRQTCLLFA
jgi:cathepsin D